MGIYICGFTISTLIIAYAEKKNRKLFIVLSTFALMIPCLIAGLRDTSVGTDVLVYVEPLTNAALNSKSFTEYLSTYWFHIWTNYYTIDYEIGFSILVYIVTKIFRNIHAVLFFIQLLTIVPIYTAISKYREKYPVWIGMSIYYLMFFNSTLNMMRQWIAMGFLLLSFQKFNNKNKKWIVYLIIACLFHYSAIIGLVFYFAYKFIYRQKKYKLVLGKKNISNDLISILILVFIMFLIVFASELLLKFIGIIGLDKFVGYINGNVHLVIGQIIIRIPLILLYIINWRVINKNDRLAPYYITMLFWDLIVSQLISVNMYSFRISMYFGMFNIISMPAIIATHKSKKIKILMTLLLLLFLAYYWYFSYVYKGLHQTIPYIFHI